MFRPAVTLILIFSFYISAADSIGHLFERTEKTAIKITDENNRKLPVDSICVIIPEPYPEIATLHSSTYKYHTGSSLHNEKEYYLLRSHSIIKSFVLVVFSNSKKYTTDLVTKCPGNELFIFQVKKDKLADISPFFHEYWSVYFLSLLVTLLVEILFGLKFLDTQRISSYLITFTLVNLVTHFTAWYIYSHSTEPVPILFLELAVMAIESLYWKFFLNSSYGKAIKISVLLNLASWITGAFVTSLI